MTKKEKDRIEELTQAVDKLSKKVEELSNKPAPIQFVPVERVVYPHPYRYPYYPFWSETVTNGDGVTYTISSEDGSNGPMVLI